MIEIRNAALCLLVAIAAPAAASGPAPSAVCDAYWEQKYQDALKLAAQIVSSAEASPSDKVEAYKCQTCTYVAQRQVDPARRSIADMLGLDKSARFTPDYNYPPPVIDLYNAVRDSLYPGTMDIHTVAVGDFEDNSPFKGKFKDYDFSLFRLALAHTVMADLAEATPLKIVDRQRTGTLLKEIELGQSGFVSPQEAVHFGQMLGAQSFIFGQYMILSKDTVRIDARLVHTATGEVILTKQVTGNFGGDPKKFLILEQDLVKALADGVQQLLAGQGEKIPLDQMTSQFFEKKMDGIKDRKAYVESKFRIAEALETEDKGDYRKAKALWQKVLEIDPENEIANRRIMALSSVAQG